MKIKGMKKAAGRAEKSVTEPVSEIEEVTTSPTGSQSTAIDLCGDFLDGPAFSVPIADYQYLFLQPLRSTEAFGRIIDLLQLPCSHEMRKFTGVEGLPRNLIPTFEQRTIPHQMHIDILPWPSIRTNILKQMATINQSELSLDLERNHLKVWGSTPWDPMGWEMSEEFLHKWWFLLDLSVLQSTNFWRAQRGERKISFPSSSLVIE